MKWDGSNNDYKFLSTPSARRATSSRDFLYSSMSISIHALREEGDLAAICSTAPRFTISIHALREEGDVTLRYAVWGFFISIHALREEGDRVAGFFFCHSANFYPRPPRGGRPVFRLLWLYHSIFLSTPSARRATHPYSSWERGSNISIHALREEGDLLEGFLVLVDVDFYPRPPRGGRPATTSPHGSRSYFYPRPPRGGRPFLIASRMRSSVFLSTPSARRATAPLILIGGNIMISIHALREEGDASATPTS